ncbi:hypothetical protein ACWDSJ_04795 [Nocardia sp. NPDC003482]
MTIKIEYSTRDELRRRREEILQRIGMSRSELAKIADNYALTPEELAAWDEVRSVEFLLEDA